MMEPISFINGIGVGAGFAIIAAIFTTWISWRLELRRIYLAPFRKWCAESYGELYEFKSRYLEENRDLSEIPDVLIILDYRDLHEVLRYAPRWIGKVRKEDEDVANEFIELVKEVDKRWHSLELPSTKDVETFEKWFLELNKNKRKKTAKRARGHLEEICEHLKDVKKQELQRIDIILKYLEKRIP